MQFDVSRPGGIQGGSIEGDPHKIAFGRRSLIALRKIDPVVVVMPEPVFRVIARAAFTVTLPLPSELMAVEALIVKLLLALKVSWLPEFQEMLALVWRVMSPSPGVPVPEDVDHQDPTDWRKAAMSLA
ncbi:MAG: hypothetical protein R3F31_25385 [Verrucomicrobiales bacterium]